MCVDRSKKKISLLKSKKKNVPKLKHYIGVEKLEKRKAFRKLSHTWWNPVELFCCPLFFARPTFRWLKFHAFCVVHSSLSTSDFVKAKGVAFQVTHRQTSLQYLTVSSPFFFLYQFFFYLTSDQVSTEKAIYQSYINLAKIRLFHVGVFFLALSFFIRSRNLKGLLHELFLLLE